MAVKNYYSKLDDVSDSEFLRNYFESLIKCDSSDEKKIKRAKQKGYNFVSMLKRYLACRKISLEELIANDKAELNHFERFIEDDSIKLSRKSKQIMTSQIKSFLRFCGVDIPKNDRKKTLLFDDDEIMIKHLNNDVGQSWNTQRQVNRAIAFFVQYRQSINDNINTPTDLINEIKEEKITNEELKDKLLEFFNWRKSQQDNSYRYRNSSKKISDNYAWVQVNNIIMFYLHRANILIKLPNNRRPKDEKSLSLPMGLGIQSAKIVTKELMKDKLLLSADLRTSAVLMIAFESGCNPVDISTLQYHHFFDVKDGIKINHLNLDNPYSIPKDKIVFVKHRRAKTSREFIVTLSGQSLRLISLFLKAKKEGKYGYPEEINDNTYIISSTKTPYKKLTSSTIHLLFTKSSTRAGIEPHKPNDFRNSFISRMKALTFDVVVKTVVGHNLGLDKNYIVFDKDTETNLEKGIINAYLEYKQCWKKLFDLDNTEVLEKKIRNELENEHKQLEKKFIEMKMELEEIKEQRQSNDLEQKEREEILMDQESVTVTDKQAKTYLSSLSKDELVELLLTKEKAKS
ncbi:MAG: hypothetical protein ACTSQN_12175 [Candidatus Heimdallarchaeota archaeon]